MSDDKKFDIMIGEPKEEIDLGKDFQAKFYLYLYDKNGNRINQADLVNEGTTAKLQVLVTKNSNEFPDKVSEFTCRLKEIKNCEQTADGKLIITADGQEEKKILDRINNVNGNLVANYFGNEIGGDGRLLENGSDIRFKIEKDQAEGRGVRVDIYKCPDDSPIKAGQKDIQKIAGKRIEIDLIWNRRIQLNLKNDMLKFVPPQTTSEPRKWKPWQIGLLVGGSAIVLLGIIFLIFYRQIKDWWRKRKNKKESQLEVF